MNGGISGWLKLNFNIQNEQFWNRYYSNMDLHALQFMRLPSIFPFVISVFLSTILVGLIFLTVLLFWQIWLCVSFLFPLLIMTYHMIFGLHSSLVKFFIHSLIRYINQKKHISWLTDMRRYKRAYTLTHPETLHHKHTHTHKYTHAFELWGDHVQYILHLWLFLITTWPILLL